MHILFATVEFVTEKVCDGGLANYLAKASKIFAEHGHKVTVVVLAEKSETFLFQKNVEVVRVLKDEAGISLILDHLSNMEIKREIMHCWYSYKINQTIKDIHKRDRIDIVQYCHINALGLFRAKNIPSVVRMSAFVPVSRLIHKTDFNIKREDVRIELADKLDFCAMKRADSIFAPSVLVANMVKKYVGLETTVLETPSMGVDCCTLVQVPDVLKDKRYLLYFGTINHAKGIKTIVQSIYRILDENPDIYFVFVGKDCGVSMKEGVRSPAIRLLKENAKEYGNRVVYLQAIHDRQLLNGIISHAEICVLPFRWENLPNTCIEAMEFGKIVISTYKSGVSQLIKNEYNGFLVQQNDPDALACKVHEVLEMPEIDKKLISANAMKRIERMNPENFYRYMMQYYKAVIKKSKNS